MSGRGAEHIHSGRALLGRLAGRVPRLWHRRSEAEIYVAAAAAALFGPRKAGLWSMFSAYFDESGTHAGSEFLVVAGLVSSPRAWEKFTTRWQRILDSEGLQRVHMRELAHRRGEFSGWSKEKTDQLMRRIIPAIRQTVQYRVWSAVRVSDLPELPMKDLLYGFCMDGCASRLRLLAERHSTYIPYMFEQGGAHSKAMIEELQKLYETGQGDLYRAGPISIGDPRRCLPLQAADVHAYETHKYLADQLRTKELRIRGSLRELWGIREVGGFLFERDELLRLINGIVKREQPVQIPADFMNRSGPLRIANKKDSS